ncbi:hypothetical protein HFP72_08425 [Nocardiopsis sp. ARC36]
MVFVVVAVALVGALGILNLLLAIGVVRRLREHTALLEGRPGAADDDLPASAAPVGTRVGAFRARSTLGSELVFEETAVPLLVAVLSPTAPRAVNACPSSSTTPPGIRTSGSSPW